MSSSLEFKNIDNPSVTILGYHEQSIEQIRELYSRGRLFTLMDGKGEFTLIIESSNNLSVITSHIGAIHYFYYYDGIRFCHGQHIIDIVKKLGLTWEWDWDSIGDLCELENLTQNRTLHKNIKRVPAGSVLTFDRVLTIRTQNLLDSFEITDADPREAVSELNKETERIATSQPYLSLSGGFDSRVILSSLLKQEIFPQVVTVGGDSSSDSEVAGAIAKRYGLEHIKIQLSLKDLLANARHIAYITNGSKPACHWHTYLYPIKADIPKNQSFFVGTLGEFARCYYFDKGMLAEGVDWIGEYAQKMFWELKLERHRTVNEDELEFLSDNLRKQVDEGGRNSRATRIAKLAKGRLLEGGTRYYLEQRVPNFYANGIRMYNESSLWRSPFHNIKWLRIIWSLDNRWKLGSNWHRFTIKKNFPSLLDFPEEKGFNRKKMLPNAVPLYWTSIAQRNKYKSYDLSSEWYKTFEVRDFILDNKILLDEFVSDSYCEKIMKEHQRFGNRTRTISFLMTLICFKQAMGERT